MNAVQRLRRFRFASIVPSPPGRLEWLIGIGLAVALISVNIPVQLSFYPTTGAAVALLVPLVIVQGATIPLVLAAPRTAAALHVVSVLGIAIGSTTVWTADDGTTSPTTLPWPMPVVGMIALAVLLAALALRGRVLAGLATWLAAILVLDTVSRAATGGDPVAERVFVDIVVAASVSATVFAIAATVTQLVQARRDVDLARHEKEVLEEDRRWDIERSRIAREMHDVVAHSMSIVHMRATSARYRLHGMSDEVADEFDGIALQARTALGEMRGLLGVLREGAETLDAPQPTLADLPALVAATRDAGIVVRTVLPEPLPEPSSAVQLALYRVTQESVSNVIRHADGSSVDITLRALDDELVLTVRNTRPPTSNASADHGGHGIRGMIERMASVDGSLTHGHDPDGGYTVTARVPWRTGSRA